MLLVPLLASIALAADDVDRAQPPPRCPMLPSEADIDAGLLVDRLIVQVDPTDARVMNGLSLAGMDPHLVVPMAAWRDSLRWTRSGDVAAIVAEDPLELAGDDLTAPLRSGGALRFGDAWLATATSLPAPSRDWSLLAGPYDADIWGVAAALRLPDGSVLQLAGFLTGSFAADPVCRDALVTRLTTAQAGPRTRDLGGTTMSLQIMVGGSIEFPVAPGFALHVSANTEAELFSAQAWRGPGTGAREAYSIVVDILPFDKVPRVRKHVVARDRVLGERAVWAVSPEAADGEEAWIGGIFGPKREGVIRLEVFAPTPERRAALRAILEQATLELAGGLEGGRGQVPVINVQAPGELPLQ